MTVKTRRFRPSPAFVISCVALFVALTGSAFAAGLIRANSVGTRQIVDGGVHTADIQEQSVDVTKLAPNSVTLTQIGENAVDGPEILHDSVAASDLGRVQILANQTTIEPGKIGGANIECNAGEQLLSGGGGSQPGVETFSTRPVDENGWFYRAKNNTSTNQTVTVDVLCLAAE